MIDLLRRRALFSLVCGMYNIANGLFALLIGVRGKLCSVALPGHLLYYSRTSMAQTSLRPWKLVRDMGSSSH